MEEIIINKGRLKNDEITEVIDKARIILRNKKTKEIILTRFNRVYFLPGGKIEDKEKVLNTIIREVKEETNIDIHIIEEYRYESHYSPKENVEKTVVFFLAKNKSEKLEKQDAEIANIGWFSYKEALDIITYDNAKELYKKAYNDYINKVK